MGIFDRKPNVARFAEREDVEGLINVLREYKEDSKVFFEAIIGLGLLADGGLSDERAIEPLSKALNSRDPFVRAYAAGALGLLGDKRGIKPLIDALGGASNDLRKYATETLGKIGEIAVEPLITALKHNDKFVRAQAANALGLLGNKRAVKPLEKLIKGEKEDEVKITAKLAIRMIQNENG